MCLDKAVGLCFCPDAQTGFSLTSWCQ